MRVLIDNDRLYVCLDWSHWEWRGWRYPDGRREALIGPLHIKLR